MGVSTSAHPWSQAFALPPVKDKQRSQPTPSDYTYSQPIIYNKVWLGYNLPAKTFRCITSVTGFKVAKFETTE